MRIEYRRITEITEMKGQRVDLEVTVEVTREDLNPFDVMAEDPGAPSDTRHPLTALALETLDAAVKVVK